MMNLLAWADTFHWMTKNTNSEQKLSNAGDKLFGIFSSGYNLLEVVGLIVFMLSLGACAIKFMYSRSRRARMLEENKDQILYVFACFGAMGLIVTMVGIAIDIGNKF